MTITWMDGFDLYTGTNDGTQRYITYPGFESYVTGRLGSGQAVYYGGSGQALRFSNNAGSTASALALGFGIKMDSVGNGTLAEFYNVGSQICQLELNTAGQLIAKRNSNVLGSSAAALIAPGVWNYIEVEFSRNSSTGTFKVYVNGLQVINLTAQNTGASDIDSIFAGSTGAGAYAIDDLYCTNVATKLGECRIDVLRPTADTGTKQWTASSGSNNYACVDDTTFDFTDYVSTNTAGNKDYYDVADLSFNPATIYAVNVISVAKKDDATTRTFRANVKSSSTEGHGATRGLGTSFTLYSDIFEQDPNASAAWTQSTVNALQLGLEVVS